MDNFAGLQLAAQMTGRRNNPHRWLEDVERSDEVIDKFKGNCARLALGAVALVRACYARGKSIRPASAPAAR